jgi:hypothetical protein
MIAEEQAATPVDRGGGKLRCLLLAIFFSVLCNSGILGLHEAKPEFPGSKFSTQISGVNFGN